MTSILAYGAALCLAAKVGADLDDLQQAWLAASLSDRTSEAQALTDQMNPAQAIEAGMFMVSGVQACAR